MSPKNDLAPVVVSDLLALGTDARRRIEDQAARVHEMRTAYLNVDGAQRFAVTVSNDRIKIEGQPVHGMVPPDKAKTLLEPFVDCCLSLKLGAGGTLVWRRLPTAELDEGKVKLTARLLWLGDLEEPDPDGHGFTA